MNSLVAVVRKATEFANDYELDLQAERRRNLYSILASVTAEVGELAQEVAIKSGQCYKPVGEDGIVGEAVDVIVAALDLIFVADPTITEKDIVEIARRKTNKWLSKIS